METAERAGLLSNEHFSVDGTLIQAWASHKSFVRKDDSGNDIDDQGDKSAGDATDNTRNTRNTRNTSNTSNTSNSNAGADFKDQTRSNATHKSSTDAPMHCCTARATTRAGCASWATP